jgi:hypothetical protein
MRLEPLVILVTAGIRPSTYILTPILKGRSPRSSAQLRLAPTLNAASDDIEQHAAAADAALSGALTTLGEGDVRGAQEQLGAAKSGYIFAGLADERAALVAMVPPPL